MKSLLRALALSALATAATLPAQAQVRPVFGLLLTGGGETLAQGSYDDGSTWEVNSGGLLHVFAGAEFHQPEAPVAVQINLGYQVDNTTASNGSVRFSRYPLEGLVLWQPQDWFRAGVGFRKSLGAQLSSTGVASGVGNFNFNSQLGMVVQGEYLVSQNFSLLLRWVSERYEVNGVEIDGSHVGAGLGLRF